MEKRPLMLRIQIILLMIVVCFQDGNLDAQRIDRSKKGSSAIHQFQLNGFTEMQSADSVRVVARLDVPSTALQFLKSENGFSAAFEATISLVNNDGIQVGKKSWQKNIHVNNYIETTSREMVQYLTTEFTVGKGSYTVIGNVLDNDTRKAGVKKESIELIKLGEPVFLLYPVLLEEKEGEWGFGKNEFPISGSRLDVGKNTLTILFSGKVNPGTFKIKSAISETKKVDDWTYSVDHMSDSGIFSERIIVPRDEFSSIKMFIAGEITQGKKSASQRKPIMMKRPGISRTITNVDEAMEQMRYILESDERKLLKDANRHEREQLFLSFWADRDPTPETSKNELMDEYYMRVAYAKQNFESFQPGWKTDMGMIYIMFGPPDEVERYDQPSKGYARRTWHYYRINRSFVFVDDTGFGDFRLTTPFMRQY
jgi:GWxTD domain-containing protein